VPLGKEIPPNQRIKEGYPLRNRNFTIIGSSSVRTVDAAYHNKQCDELSGSANIDDLERLLTQKYGVLVNFSLF